MGKTYSTGRRKPMNMPKSKKELLDLLNNKARPDHKFTDTAERLQTSKVTLSAWCKLYGVKRVYHYE